MLAGGAGLIAVLGIAESVVGSGQAPLRLLEGRHGRLMTNGYDGYGALTHTGGLSASRAGPTRGAV